MEINNSLLKNNTFDIIPSSYICHRNIEYALVRSNSGKQLVVSGKANDLVGFEGVYSELAGNTIMIGSCNQQNAVVLRNRLEWLAPIPLGLKTSAGMGDRLGLATPGHVRAMQACIGKISPIFAQQSMREMSRTNRLPEIVMADATWGMFQEGWKGPCGADADHLKTREDIDVCVAAGFTFFTIDPGEFVNNKAESLRLNDLRQLVDSFPSMLQPSQTGLLNKKIDFEEVRFSFTEMTLLKAIIKYGKAIFHVVDLYHYLMTVKGENQFELEVSVDETALPTSHAEHYYIASELKRFGVKWVSLAPRFIGKFEKGVDYIGDPADFLKDIGGHASISRLLGPYKISLHSGSDKFSIYKAAMKQTQGFVHLKTAGTSYLEALRTIAQTDHSLFKEIYVFARENYLSDKVSYHVSAELQKAPPADKVNDLTSLLDEFNVRQILHVTFGSTLTVMTSSGQYRFKDRILANLELHNELYAENLKTHFSRHLSPFCEGDEHG